MSWEKGFQSALECTRDESLTERLSEGSEYFRVKHWLVSWIRGFWRAVFMVPGRGGFFLLDCEIGG